MEYHSSLSEPIVRAYRSSPGPVRQEVQSELRLKYLELFRGPLANVRETLITTAREIASAVLPTGTVDITHVTISCRGRERKFAVAEHPVVLIGRHNICDFPAFEYDGAFSRVSAVVFLYPRQVVVVNPGNINGNYLVSAGNTDNVPVFNLTPETNTNLNICTHVFSFGPESNLCCLCEDEPRSQRLSCGHLTCLGCYERLSEPKRCPFCRHEHVRAHGSERAQLSYAPQL